MTKSLKLTAIFNALRTVMGFLFPLITFPYSSRVLGPIGIGKANFASSIVSYFAMIAMLGVSCYGIREAGKYRNDKRLLSKFVKEILAINLIASAVAYILLFSAVFLLPSFFEYRALIIVYSATILFTVIGLDWLFYAVEELGFVTLRTFIFQVVSLALLFTFVKTSGDYIKYAGISVVSSVGANIFSLFCARKYVDFKSHITLELKKHIKPIFVFFMMAVAATVNSSIDTTMLGFISGAEQVGYYSSALKVVRLVVDVATSMTVILPRLSAYHDAGDFENFKNLATRTFNANVVLTLPASVGLFFIANNTIVLLSGKTYLASVPVLKALSGTIVFLAISNLAGGHILLSLGKENVSFFAALAGIAFNIAANLLLIPNYGAFGAGAATFLGELSVALVEFIYVRKTLAFRPIIKNLLQCVLATALMVFVLHFISALNIPVAMNLLLSIIMGGGIYFATLLHLGNEQIHSAFVSLISKMRSKKCKTN